MGKEPVMLTIFGQVKLTLGGVLYSEEERIGPEQGGIGKMKDNGIGVFKFVMEKMWLTCSGILYGRNKYGFDSFGSH